MTTLNPYLVFKGNCSEAFHFYKSVFAVEFNYIGKYKDIPPSDKKLFPPEADEKIMHVSLPLSAETILMGCDSVDPEVEDHSSTKNFSLSITTDRREEADRLFSELSSDGLAKMPMENTFWGSYFGTLTDKFGINWMISVDTKID